MFPLVIYSCSYMELVIDITRHLEASGHIFKINRFIFLFLRMTLQSHHQSLQEKSLLPE